MEAISARNSDPVAGSKKCKKNHQLIPLEIVSKLTSVSVDEQDLIHSVQEFPSEDRVSMIRNQEIVEAQQHHPSRFP